MRMGWLYDGGSWYYLSGSGAMVAGWYEVSEHIYQFATSGRMYEPQMTPATTTGGSATTATSATSRWA